MPLILWSLTNYLIQDGYELISEALNLLNNVYGAMHPEIAQVEYFQEVQPLAMMVIGDYHDH